MTTQHTTRSHDDRDRRRKMLAILAGGLTLGVGAAATLAAWTDPEFASGDFEAGQFALESSADGTAFTGTSDDSMLTLSFAPLAQNLSPNDSVSAVYAVRLDQASDYNAAVAGSVTATGAAADNLSYSIQRVTDISGAEAMGAALVDGEAVTAGATHEGLFTLNALTDVAYLKVTVTADSGLGQGETSNIVWTLTGTSGTQLD